METRIIDRRVSTPSYLCKHCGLDIGLYPSMHKCQQQQQQQQRNLYFSPLPPIPNRRLSGTEQQPLQVSRKPIHSPNSQSTSGSSSHFITTSSSPASSSTSSFYHSSSTLSDTTTPASSSPSSGKWSQFSQNSNKQQKRSSLSGGDDSNYLNNFTTHLPKQEKKTKNLWRKVRHAQNWEALIHQGNIQKPDGKIWGKLRLVAQHVADKIPYHDDQGPESDESDWEGETHVSRILREYYEKKRRPLPNWFHDDPDVPHTKTNHHQQRHSKDATNSMPSHSPAHSRRRLWDQEQQSPMLERDFNNRNHQKSNTNDYHVSTTYQSPNRNGRKDDDVRRTYNDNGNSLQHRSDLPQRQQDWMNVDDRFPPASHYDRLHGPRARSSKYNHS